MPARSRLSPLGVGVKPLVGMLVPTRDLARIARELARVATELHKVVVALATELAKARRNVWPQHRLWMRGNYLYSPFFVESRGEPMSTVGEECEN